MTWEYTIVDLAMATFKRTEADILNSAAADGWEFVLIIPPYRAVLKRCLHDHLKQIASTSSSRAPAPIKYRDPQTGDTWTGRGKMASWLAAKVDAGEPLERYLVAE